ncbi:MAG TPA: hypothetical protein VJ063_09855 [Verrucomicrobiae bacterium]|nr:hypothetical protein [Verrucomicrobiae bacterium]
MKNWVGAWLGFALAVLIGGQLFKVSPTVQFYVAVPLVVIAAVVCLILVVEKP